MQTTTSDRSVTYFRLAALPPAWIEARHFLIEDHVGHLYLFDPTDASLDRIGAAEANVLMQWYELSQAVTWYTRSDLIQKLTAIASRIRLTSERDDPERYCTFMSPDALADTNLDLCY